MSPVLWALPLCDALSLPPCRTPIWAPPPSPCSALWDRRCRSSSSCIFLHTPRSLGCFCVFCVCRHVCERVIFVCVFVCFLPVCSRSECCAGPLTLSVQVSDGVLSGWVLQLSLFHRPFASYPGHQLDTGTSLILVVSSCAGV